MDRTDILITINAFTALIEKGEASVHENEKRLSLLLDRLALIRHYIPDEASTAERPDLPEVDESKLRQLICSRFSNYGYYTVAGNISTNIAETEIHTGDAIDDLLDITLELRFVLRHLNNTSIDIALGYFRWSFDTHWGMHLRGLQLYLQALRQEV